MAHSADKARPETGKTYFARMAGPSGKSRHVMSGQRGASLQGRPIPPSLKEIRKVLGKFGI